MKKEKSKIIIIGLSLAIIMVIALISYLLFMNSKDQRVKRQLSVGEKYLEEMNYENAILAYNLVLEIDPMSEDAYLGLADAYIGLQDYAMAFETANLGLSKIGKSRDLTSILSIIEEKRNKEDQNEKETKDEPEPDEDSDSESVPEDVETDIDSTDNNMYASSYIEMINNYEVEHGTGVDNGFQYDLIWFDDDDIPELVAGLNDYYVSMYTYDADSDEVFCVIEDWPYGAGGNEGYEYIPRGNVLRNYNSDYAGMIRYTYYGRMNSSRELEEIGTLEEDYYIDLNGDGEPSWEPDEYTDEVQRYYNLTGDREISETEYNRLTYTGDFRMIEGQHGADKMKDILSDILNGIAYGD